MNSAASNIFYAAGSTGVGIVIQIFVADTTSLLNRALFSSLPDFPYVATTWIGPELVQAIGPQENWRWGFGMWAIIIPISFLPLLYSLVANELKAKKMGLLPPSNFRGLSFVSAAKKTWVDLDMMGLILFTAGLIMVLVPLTLTGVYNKLWDWSSARTICLVVFGFIVLGLFVAWESMPRLCARPMMSLKLIKDPTWVLLLPYYQSLRC